MRLNKGFTLAEMAIVIVIASILLVTGVKVLTAQMDNAAYSATRSKQEQIKEMLITYLGNNKRLPCPDTRNGQGPGAISFSTANPPDGSENRSPSGDVTGNCARYFGVLPYQTLGLSRDVALDGWGNYFSYQLASTADWEKTASFAVNNVGNVTVNDRDSGGATVALTTEAVALVISHGKNGLGAYNIKGTRSTLPGGADEADNTDTNGDRDFFEREYNDNATATGGPFDDLVMYLSADDLIAPLQREGTFDRPVAIVNQQLADIRDAIVGSMMGGCATPVNMGALGLPASTTQDPWGTNIDYNRTLNSLTGQAAADEALRVRSFGENLVDDGGGVDDYQFAMTVGQLRALVGPYGGGCL